MANRVPGEHRVGVSNIFTKCKEKFESGNGGAFKCTCLFFSFCKSFRQKIINPTHVKNSWFFLTPFYPHTLFTDALTIILA